MNHSNSSPIAVSHRIRLTDTSPVGESDPCQEANPDLEDHNAQSLDDLLFTNNAAPVEGDDGISEGDIPY